MSDIDAVLPDLKLKFNLSHPSFEECYLFGYECALANLTEDDNPFLHNTKEAELWLDGWWAGFYGEQPIFDAASISHSMSRIPQKADNDDAYHSNLGGTIIVLCEIAGVIAVTALLGYQFLEFVA